MYFTKENNTIIGRREHETLRVEAWGKNALRVRSTRYPSFSGCDRALSENDVCQADIRFDGEDAFITNGRISAKINVSGVITFYRDGEMILREYYRSYGGTESKESACLKVINREYRPIIGGDYKITVRFDSNNGESVYGMGQYQHEYLDLKGCVLELAQRNSQISIPFYLSSLNYGFLWNNPAVGRCTFGKNMTEWIAEASEEVDYWITADESPAAIIENYTAQVGRAPVMPENIMGLWQCKLRYRTQQEVLDVAREYKRRGIPLDVIVIDYFHWPRQGDWCFDEEYWPDPKAMCDELHQMGIRVMVSVWPSVDRKSRNFWEMMNRGMLVSTEHGATQTYDFGGDCVTFDATNPEAREFIWDTCKKSYYDKGIDMFWLDNAEPDYAQYDYENYRFWAGPHIKVGNIYPMMYAKAFYDGQVRAGQDGIVNLLRSAWVGSQKYATVIWSGDVQSTYESFRDQVSAGLNMGISGFPWWTTDIGGFMYGDVHDPAFIQLLIRWFQFAVFCPVLRLHGDRDPHDIPALSDKDFGGGFMPTGQPNEMWSYGTEAYEIMRKYLDIRLSLKDYIMELNYQAHNTGAPLMRMMHFEFPNDPVCEGISSQYMFGSRYLVAPITEPDASSVRVYLPEGTWKGFFDGKLYAPGWHDAAAPIDIIPVFEKL